MRFLVMLALLVPTLLWFGQAVSAAERHGALPRQIGEGLRRDRPSWLDLAVRTLEREIPEFSTGQRLERRVFGEADAAMKAMQLYLVAVVMNEKEYVNRSEGSAFMTTLRGVLATDDHASIDRFFERYTENLDFRGQGLFRFGMDIARHVRTDAQATPAPALIGIEVKTLKDMVEATVAEVFGDSRAATAARARVLNRLKAK